MEYKCYKCFYITQRKSNFISHLNRLKKCSRNNKNTFTEDEINSLNNKQIFRLSKYIPFIYMVFYSL